MYTLWKVLTRRKVLDHAATQETPLARVLNTFDLTALGVGSTLGVGVYVLAGQVAKNTAGPAVIISFLIAAVASVFAGLCYAEFGARTPKAGSAYIYSYLCVGEFIAFVIGWNLILEYIIGSASVAKGLSSYVDNLWNGTLSSTFLRIAPIDIPFLSSYFDIFAFSVSLLLAIALAFGMKESSLVNNIFTSVNVGLVLFVIIAGSLNAHLSNWFIDPKDVKNVTNGTQIGSGGFFPFGFEGVIKGAATCFYGFVGFDCIATTGEEVKNPKKAIPIAIIVSLFIIFLAYFGTSTVLTLMVPYYEQNPTAPIPFAFDSVQWHTAAIIVTIGALFGLYASLFGAMFPLPRILYAMASDGLIFKCMGHVNERFKTPVIGTLFAGLFTGLMAAIFNLDSLVNMMSIGTLLAYTIVAACVLLLRYTETPDHNAAINDSDETALTSSEHNSVIRTIFNFNRYEVPNERTQTVVSINICLYCVLCFLLGLCALHLKNGILNREIFPLVCVSVILLLIALTMLSIVSQPVSKKELSFQVPWVPLIPALSILFNIYLMIMLDIATWIRFVVWMAVGFPIFCLSGTSISNLVENSSTEGQGRPNCGFYDDNLIYLNNSNTYSNQETSVMTQQEKKSPSLHIFDDPVNDSKVLTPSPSRVLERLDFVIDSFVDDQNSPSVSVEYVSSALDASPAFALSNQSLDADFRDTPNRALRTELLNNLNESEDDENSDGSKGTFKTVVENNSVNNSSHVNPTNEPDSDSENSYVSASSSIDFVKNEDNSSNDRTKTFIPPQSPLVEGFNNSSEETVELNHGTPNSFIPPPPPSMIDFNTFSLQKKIKPISEATPLQKDLPSIPTKMKKNSSPMIINEGFLNSVKLRHVERPSLEERSKNIEGTPPQQSKPSQYIRSKSVGPNSNDKYNKKEKEYPNTNTLPKMEISKDVISSVKLKHVSRPPLSEVEIRQEEKPDSLKFGSPEFEQFRDTLNYKLKNPANVRQVPSFIGPKRMQKKEEVKVNKENVIEDSIDIAKARATIQAEVTAKLNILNNTNSEITINEQRDPDDLVD
ncbi:hypothetical protein HHI36_008835 [Cryptolaemus montrouzieri]|uniref:Cationic amino acid transporter C-terminal domain-containing protein n=1 Tax=Cryptolaemus montrouzieri TaxID=559131 RepID=A0ABD2MTK2_9CUCU